MKRQRVDSATSLTDTTHKLRNRIEELQEGALAVGTKNFSIYRQCFRPDLEPATMKQMADCVLSHVLSYVGLVPKLLLVNKLWAQIVRDTGGWATCIPKELCELKRRRELEFILRYGGKRITHLEWPRHLDLHHGGGADFACVCLDDKFFLQVPNLRHVAHIGGLYWAWLDYLLKYAQKFHFTCSIWAWEPEYNSFETHLSRGSIAELVPKYEKHFDFTPLLEHLVIKHEQRFFQSDYLFESIKRHFPQSYEQKLVPLQRYPAATVPGDVFALVSRLR
jgi:hypothetical protein